ncbi:hypothetical protein D3C72_2154050 [compost metagenome]
MRVLDQHRHAEHGVAHVHLHPERDAQRAQQPGAAAEQVAVARDHGEVGPGADHGEEGDAGDGQRFGKGRHISEFSGSIEVGWRRYSRQTG